MQNPTPHTEVNLVLDALLAEAREILGEQFVGIYLYGSLATGDFNPHRSDIDFIVVTRDLLPDSTIEQLEEMHNALWSDGGKWHQKTEGLYIPLAELRRYDARGPELPTINEGRFYLAGQGSDWVLQRYTLREQETIVDGPSIRDYIDPVSAQEMQTAVRQILESWWAPMLDDPAWIKDAEYQAFAVLSMCRALYTLQHGTAVSKSDAARWAMQTLDERWRDLIQEAAAWGRGRPFDQLDHLLDFIRYTVTSSQELL